MVHVALLIAVTLKIFLFAGSSFAGEKFRMDCEFRMELYSEKMEDTYTVVPVIFSADQTLKLARFIVTPDKTLWASLLGGITLNGGAYEDGQIYMRISIKRQMSALHKGYLSPETANLDSKVDATLRVEVPSTYVLTREMLSPGFEENLDREKQSLFPQKTA